jgi:formylglycine-generating enzyme required for sulfatase activity
MEMLPVNSATWNRPNGRNSSITDKFTEPVVHVSYNDAFAYCASKNMRLPTEIEWEYAARGGLKEKSYPWGDFWNLKRANLWQGNFPNENQLRDGFYAASPVDAFEPQNNYQMRDMIGNVWEWTSTK